MPPGLDADALRRAMEVFAEALRWHREALDSLNVFPVPDGDTGSNLVLTQSAVVGAIEGAAGSDPAELGEAIARASLMGARGNSGVILSQALRALCRSMGSVGIGSGPQMAEALESAAVQARRAVARPADGTMLTVLSDAARAGERSAGEGGNVERVLAAAVEQARASLGRTTAQLPELRRAGVVDAGAKGVVLLLDALLAGVTGRAIEEPVGELGPVHRRGPAGEPPRLTFPFEVQCLVEADEPSAAELREALTAVGDSVVVVGGGGLYHVHVHTGDPVAARAAVARRGPIHDVSVTDLAEQVSACFGLEARAVRVGEARTALVAVVEGDELRAVFRSLGALVPAAPDDVVASVERSGPGSEEVIVLVAGEPSMAEALSGTIRVRTIVASSIPAALSAATAFNAMADLDRNALDMEKAIEATATGEVVGTEAGVWVGRTGGVDVARNGSASACLDAVIRRLLARAEEAELVTVVVSTHGSGGVDLMDLSRDISEGRPGIRVQVFAAGPTGPAFAVGVE
jgi:uncharacterized protein